MPILVAICQTVQELWQIVQIWRGFLSLDIQFLGSKTVHQPSIEPGVKGRTQKQRPTATPSRQSSPFAAVREWDDRFLALFPHRFDFIHAPHPQPGDKPQWQTERRYPLSDRLINQGAQLYGVRFGNTTHYFTLDIDIRSVYHPRQDAFAIPRLIDALETLGITKAVICTSSVSGGIHLYCPFAEAQPSDQLALAVRVILANAGFISAPGQLEIFPNERQVVDGIPSLFNAHRLPMQAGSYLLNRDFQPIWSDATTFVQHWNLAQSHNDLNTKTLKRVLKVAHRQRYRVSRKANQLLNDLTTEIYQGWTGPGQTNRLLGRIAMYCYIFWDTLHGGVPLVGQALVEQIVQIAQSLPGYTDFCGHQHEIEARAQDWATSVENSRYYPYSTRKQAKSPQATQADNTKPPSTWHHDQQASARERICQAIAQLLETNTLPALPTARFHALVKHGIGGGTLYKYKDLWHPEYLIDRESPPLASPPEQQINTGRDKSAPQHPNLLGQKSSNTLPSQGLSDPELGQVNLISSNTHSEPTGLEKVKQTVAEIRALQDYKRAAKRQIKAEQRQSVADSSPSPEYIARMQAWLVSGDPILVAEANMFFECYPPQ